MTWIPRAMSVTALMTVVASIDDDRKRENDGNWTCETKSFLWNEKVHQNLTSQCGDLKMSYNKQYCAPENTTLLHCMVERARMHDHQSCMCHRGNNVLPYLCYYDELCAFVDPEFQCSNGYNKCDVDENGRMNCTAEGHETYINNCTRGLIYCKEQYCMVQPAKYYEAECRSTYKEIFGDGRTVYYVARIHFNASNYVYSGVKALPRKGHRDPCDFSDKSTAPATDGNIILLVIVFASVTLVIVLLISIWRIRRRRAKEDERWKSILSNTLDFLTKFIQNGVHSYETTDVTEIAEQVDPVVVEFPSQSDGDVRECLLDTATNTKNTNHTTEADESRITKTDVEMSVNISLPAGFDSRESVFETDEPISSDHFSPNSAAETSTNDHGATTNVYENSTYSQMSFSSGYIPKSFDFDQEDT